MTLVKQFFVRRSSRLLPYLDWMVVLLGIALLTALLLPNVFNASAYFDEGYSAYLAKQDVLTMAGYTALDVHPPLYYALLHFWQGIAGTDVGPLRILSVIFAWIAVIFGFLTVRRWFGRHAAWLAVLLMALSPLFIRYGAAMRMYTLALAIAFAATYVLLRATADTKQRKWWIIYGVLVSAGMWTNYFTALVWLTHLIWLAYEHRQNKKIMRRWLLAVVGAVVLYLPWLPWLVFRYGEIQANGFWIKPISIDTLSSTVTQSLVFRSAADTTSWLGVGVIMLVTSLSVAGYVAYKHVKKQQQAPFRLVLAMSSLPIILLAVSSLPPLRPSYVYRYVLVAAVACSLLMAIILTYARFKQHDTAKRVGLTTLTILILMSGALQTLTHGNRNLDTNTQNKIAQAVGDAQGSGLPATLVVRSPYTYYAARLYHASNYPVKFLFYSGLAKVGSTKPLYDHPEDSVPNFNKFDKVWLIGEDKYAVVPPQSGTWTEKKRFVEYDDVTKKPIAYAVYYERTTR